MTRINSAILPRNLTDQHLIAELRELPRIFTAVNKRLDNDLEFDDIPKNFCLGIGHTKFFYDKLAFLSERHARLRFEYNFRFKKKWQFKPDYSMLHKWTSNCLFNDYPPTAEEKDLLIERISTRINSSNQIPRYYRKQITKEEAINKL